jgi:hypothetical protein
MNGIIYYTDGYRKVPPKVLEESQKSIKAASLPITAVSIGPIDFGDKNITLEGRVRSYPTMCLQILTALENSEADYVFFCEHDVLYHPSHFDFTPERDDIYYYNVNNYRWEYPIDRAITYDGLCSLSMLCVNRQTAINHYRLRMKHIERMGIDAYRSREPRWARKWGYEPGTKKRRRGGMTDEDCIFRRSEFPCVDVRHGRTFTRSKTHLHEFRRLPTNFVEVSLDQIPGWNLKEMFPEVRPYNEKELERINSLTPW